MTDALPILGQAPDGLWLTVGQRALQVPAFTSHPGDRLLLMPTGREESGDVAASLARVLTGLQPAALGKLRLFDKALGTMAYLDTLKMRTHIGLVQGRGGLLANRTVHDNVLLPLSVHGGLAHEQEVQRIDALLDDLELLTVKNLRPYLLDEAVRFRACAARALVLQPQWLVVEGMGDFEPTTHGSHTWQRMLHHVDAAQGAVVVCMPRPILAFARWWTSHGGRVLDCPLVDSLPAAQAGSVAL